MSAFLDDIEKGTPGFGLQQFLWLCVRNMTPAAGMMRDGGWRPVSQADITKMIAYEDEVVAHERGRLATAQQELETASRRDREEWRTGYDAHYSRLEQQRIDMNACGQEQLARFEAIKREFESLKPRLATFSAALVEFMDGQLSEGIRCASRHQNPYERLSLDDWIKDSLDECSKRVTWRTDDLQNALRRRAWREAWFKGLTEILPPPEAV
jgi:hypothetical protein